MLCNTTEEMVKAKVPTEETFQIRMIFYIFWKTYKEAILVLSTIEHRQDEGFNLSYKVKKNHMLTVTCSGCSDARRNHHFHLTSRTQPTELHTPWHVSHENLDFTGISIPLHFKKHSGISPHHPIFQPPIDFSHNVTTLLKELLIQNCTINFKNKN